VAEHADGWHAAFPDHPSELEPKIKALLGWCVRLGRNPHAIEWGVGVEPDDLERFLARDAGACVDLGFTQFTLGFSGPDWKVEEAAGWLAWRDRLNGE
jgi:hypothetical protein